MVTRKVLSAKKTPVKKATLKRTSPKKVNTAKVSAKKKQGKEKPKITKAGAIKTKPRKGVPREIDAMRPSASADKNKNTAVRIDTKVMKSKIKTVVPKVAIRLNTVKKATVATKAVAKAGVSRSADWMELVEKKIVEVRNEFKKALKAEITSAFDVCLSAMEQAANLMESRLVTVLGEMSNLVTGAKPDFKDGKLKSVVSENGVERTDFSYGNDGLVTSRTYRNGTLKFEIVHGKLGNPVSGKMFDSSGKIVKEFSYGPDGQVK